MIEQDTIRLLRECDAGIKMGTSSIDNALKYAENNEFKSLLKSCRDEHDRLDLKLQALLNEYNDTGKEPDSMAKGMSWIKTNIMLAINESDEKIADFITDGCNMGIKSLNKYLNKYKAADEKSKDIAKKLINLEEKLVIDIRSFL